ncbi:hypothetical protein EJB05_35164, partial [Eragrostis curvula]
MPLSSQRFIYIQGHATIRETTIRRWIALGGLIVRRYVFVRRKEADGSLGHTPPRLLHNPSPLPDASRSTGSSPDRPWPRYLRSTRSSIDTGRWDAEHPLGRLFILDHAAFVDAGFVPLPLPSRRKRRPIPREAGRTASALSLRYTAPELLRQRHGHASVLLRQQVYGRKIVFYVQRSDGRPVAFSWVAVDVFAAAALLSGGLDVTARALRRNAVSGTRCAGAPSSTCAAATFVSLPGDVKLAILARVESRRVVAELDREFRKRRYMAVART